MNLQFDPQDLNGIELLRRRCLLKNSLKILHQLYTRSRNGNYLAFFLISHQANQANRNDATVRHIKQYATSVRNHTPVNPSIETFWLPYCYPRWANENCTFSIHHIKLLM